ncbi:MAG TPA: Rrf2 family transcriptional regulator [Bryobacteraceae bacterium]|nr:Rrf2 family transcriptional regulator [Bryobacteraceae bacterium]
MQLTMHSDYGLRVLLYLAHFPGRRVGTEEISTAYGISKNHLVRVVQTLADGGFVQVTVGRSGGLELAKAPEEVRLGAVIRKTEASFRLVECHDAAANTCPIVPVCGLKGILDASLEAFLQELDQHTLADLVKPRSRDRFIQLVST